MTNLDPYDIEGQKELEDAAKKTAEFIEAQDVADFGWLMADERGRRVIWGLLTRCGIRRLGYTGEDTHDTAFNAGQRNIGLIYEVLAMEDVEKFTLMMKENKE